MNSFRSDWMGIVSNFKGLPAAHMVTSDIEFDEFNLERGCSIAFQ